MPVRGPRLNYRQSAKFEALQKIAPVPFNAALVAHLNRLGIAGEPMEFASFNARDVARYMEARRGLDRVQAGLVAAGRPQQEF